MQKTDLKINEYLEKSQKYKRVDWWELSDEIKLKLKNLPKDIKSLGNFITVRRLKKSADKNLISHEIIGIKKELFGKKCFNLHFPINLDNEYYARLYALMISEGSCTTEFSLHVPENEFHELFKESIQNLLSKETADLIKIDKNNGVLRSRAPAIVRKIIPMPETIPYLILKNKELAREYLKVAFEAEGSPIIDKKRYKRYIKLSRYVNVTNFVEKENLPREERIYSGTIKKQYPELFNKIKDYPPETLLGEQVLLKKHFDIDSNLVLEAIRNNKTDLRCGKITARWVLFIYANNIDKYIKEIGFITKEKIIKIEKMKLFKGNRPQYSTLDLIKRIEKDNHFLRKEFVIEMTKLKYKSPSCYLGRYEKNGLIKRVRKGVYKILF